MRQLQTLTMRLMNLLLQQALVQQFYKMMMGQRNFPSDTFGTFGSTRTHARTST
jgi:hypothetical protein